MLRAQISYKYQEICSRIKRPKTILQISKNITIYKVINKPVNVKGNCTNKKKKSSWQDML